MKTLSKTLRLMICGIIGGFGCSSSSYASRFDGATVGQIQGDDRPCIFFWLNGVSQPDPSISNDRWLALPKSAANYQELVSELISAKLSAKPIFVSTAGPASCGYATVYLLGLDQ